MGIKGHRCGAATGGLREGASGGGTRIRWTGFSADALALARELVPELPRGIIVTRLPAEDPQPEGLEAMLERTGSCVFHCGWEGLTCEVVQAQQAAGRPVHG